jgi:DNA-binding transcriptional LysR family regulator
MCSDIGRAPRIAHVAMEFATHVALVSQGEAIALVPRLGRGPLPTDVVAVPIVDPVSERTVSLVWRQTMSDRPALLSVMEALAAEASADLT